MQKYVFLGWSNLARQSIQILLAKPFFDLKYAQLLCMSFSLQVCLICEHKTVPDVEVSRVPYWWASYPVGMKHRTIQSKVKVQRRGIPPKQNFSGTGVFEPIPNGSLGGNGEDRTLRRDLCECSVPST